MKPETPTLSPDKGVRSTKIFRIFGGIFLGNKSRGQLSKTKMLQLIREIYKKDIGKLKTF